jgi:hypothetical protein
MAEYTFITQAQATNRISAQLLKRLMDDNRDGTADTDVVTQLMNDATSKVAGYMQGNYDLDVVATRLGENKVHEVVRLTLDAFEWMAVKRHPRAAPEHDWMELMKANNAELKLLREAFTKLDIEDDTVEPENVGGTVSPSATSAASLNTFRIGGFSDY